MPEKLKFKFDANQEHQKHAIESVIKLFDGFPKNKRRLELFHDECIPNIPQDETFDEEVIFHNLKHVQRINGLSVSAAMNTDEGFELSVQGNVSIWRYPSFTLEMETGTGKTYAYLRTMYELRQQYGFSKFIIVVPSVAIYEGTIKAIEITREHFKTLYHNEYMQVIRYDGNRLGQLRSFSHSQLFTVMIMTVAAFNKTKNNVFKPTEKLIGEKLPYEYIQETRPILILDECQNYETDISKQAIRTLHPLFAFKYSATAGVKDGRDVWQYDNLVYQLDPLEAFRRNLVKRIQVFGVTEGDNANVKMQCKIKEFTSGPKVKVKVVVNKRGRREIGEITLKQNDNLCQKTRNDDYTGFIVDNIDIASGILEFTNGERLVAKNDQQLADEKREVFGQQIEETIHQHMELQEKLNGKGIKVLSLFFIDRVMNYRGENALIKELFESIFDKQKMHYDFFKSKQAASVHEGYFAQKKTKDGIVEIDTEGGRNQEERNAEKVAFELIMKNKEQLLSFNENISFIFAHSALKEGWDNPNVFQICTLAQRYSERRKRQEIGRGMRLCVDQTGARVQDSKINILTVIANESYEDFVNGLQAEYRETGNMLPPPPTNAVRQPAKRNDNVYKKKEFVQFWNKLIQRTNYNIQIDTEKIINNAIAKFSKEIVSPPEILVRKGAYGFVKYELTAVEVCDDKSKIKLSKQATNGDDEEIIKTYRKKENLGKRLMDKALDGFTIQDFKGHDIIFSNEQILLEHESISFTVQQPISVTTSKRLEKDRVFPIFNLIERASKETILTRRTINRIFQGISDKRRKRIFDNPEGFASAFIFSIKEVLADHVAANIEYLLLGKLENYDFSKVFPSQEQHPQRQLAKGSSASLYDFVQFESDVELNFIQSRLNSDKRILCYFKFPDSFKVKLPRIIGNYVPDWGIVRQSENDSYLLELVRETKATPHENLLQYTNEKRKIWCAKKHFAEIGIDYRHITDKNTLWWESSKNDQLTFDRLMSEIQIIPNIEEGKFITHLPVFSIEAIATTFGKEEYNESLGWVEAKISHQLEPNMFVVKVVGRSMEPRIKDGSWCVFRYERGGSREGKIVLVQSRQITDPELHGRYTIKRYHSEKETLEDGTWRHKRIILSPDNKEFCNIVLENVSADDFRVVAEFVTVL